ncbi:peptide chain release factor 1 [Spirochaeta africana]|uniref:Peptide chain release factor 1 n=1 Tax=Spirochaeta africana (strain ATCC 700263 / DSM 8902 / Z-7692) TaxID=889378 RepID=H9UK37_SPIAZ|nr:peptide chain release factor 1 [Spirochaeta africana]AFG37880.1 peptide chain release factor 1 [Spirochaeta africana DSM 8902]
MELKPKLDAKVARHSEVEKLIADPELHKDPARFKELMREHSQLCELVEAYAEYRDTSQQLQDNRELLNEEKDPEMREMAKAELDELEQRSEELTKQLRLLLVPRDPMDEKSAIIEIRAGTGGDEAGLFAADLYRMYARYGERHGLKFEFITVNESEIGGFKEVVFSASGKNAYGSLRFESGVHRVQRVPATESGGRIHTSAVTVAVLPEAEDTDIQLHDNELKIDVFRSSGPGGQSVNTTDSAVRITHLPTSTVVTCQDEKSQLKNKAKAMRVLKARLYEMEEKKKQEERASFRRNQIGSGDRSERIRTYNFPQNRLTDHRINLTLYKLDLVMQGELDEILDALQLSAREEQLQDA